MLAMGRRKLMIYTIDEISSRIRPVAEKYHLKAVYLFGSYARGEARDDSDVDLLVEVHRRGSFRRGSFRLFCDRWTL